MGAMTQIGGARRAKTQNKKVGRDLHWTRIACRSAPQRCPQSTQKELVQDLLPLQRGLESESEEDILGALRTLGAALADGGDACAGVLAQGGLVEALFSACGRADQPCIQFEALQALGGGRGAQCAFLYDTCSAHVIVPTWRRPRAALVPFTRRSGPRGRSACGLPRFRPVWPNLAEILAELGRISAKVRKQLIDFGQVWRTFRPIRSTAVELGPTPADIGQFVAEIGLEFGQFRRNSAEPRPNLAKGDQPWPR